MGEYASECGRDERNDGVPAGREPSSVAEVRVYTELRRSAVPRVLKRGVPSLYVGIGTCSRGNDDVSAVFGRPKGALSMTTLKVPGSLLSDVTVCSSTVEKDRERA